MLQLTVRQFFHYFSEAQILDAERQLRALEAAAFPYMKEEHKRRLYKHYQIVAGQYFITSTKEEVESSWKRLREMRKGGVGRRM